VPYQRDAAAIIRDWRQVRHLGAANLGSPEAERLVDESDRLHEEYRLLTFEADRIRGERLPPFPVE
jgi:hypothetical protein